MSGVADTGQLGAWKYGEQCAANKDRACEAVASPDLTYLILARNLPRLRGAIAQLGERLHGMQEVVGSIPSGSTSFPRPHRLEAQDIALSRR